MKTPSAEGPRCTHPANAMLPWYLNGSLEGDEEASVREHVGSCSICGAELEILSLIGRGIEAQGALLAGPEAPGLARGAAGRRVRRTGLPFRMSRALAAALALPAAAGIWWALQGFPGSGRGEGPESPPAPGVMRRGDPSQPPEGLRLAFHVDIGNGALRSSGDVPTFRIPRGVEMVAITYPLPIDPDARHAVELRGPDGRLLARQDARPLPVQGMSKSVSTFPASLLGGAGVYRLVVVETPKDAPERLYSSPFRLEIPDR